MQIISSGPSLPPDLMLHGLHYSIFDHSDNGDVSPGYYHELLASATKRIYIWDPYCNSDPNDYSVFAAITNPVDLLLLTGISSVKSDKIDDIFSYMKQNVPNQLKKQMKISFLGIDSNIHGGKYYLHDRFLFVDERVFLIGASFGYYGGCAPGTTGIYEVTDVDDISLIFSVFDKYRQVALNGHIVRVKAIGTI
jgi:hypothetical protein